MNLAWASTKERAKKNGWRTGVRRRLTGKEMKAVLFWTERPTRMKAVKALRRKWVRGEELLPVMMKLYQLVPVDGKMVVN